MLDERDLQILKNLFMEQRQSIMHDVKILMAEGFQEQRRSIMHDVQVLMDAEFKPRFDLMAEDIQIIREKLVSEERMEEAEADIQVLKTSVRILNEDIRELKKAQ